MRSSEVFPSVHAFVRVLTEPAASGGSSASAELHSRGFALRTERVRWKFVVVQRVDVASSAGEVRSVILNRILKHCFM